MDTGYQTPRGIPFVGEWLYLNFSVIILKSKYPLSPVVMKDLFLNIHTFFWGWYLQVSGFFYRRVGFILHPSKWWGQHSIAHRNTNNRLMCLCFFSLMDLYRIQVLSNKLCISSNWSTIIGKSELDWFFNLAIHHTVDERNPAPPGMYKPCKKMGKTTYQLVQDFFHQQ